MIGTALTAVLGLCGLATATLFLRATPRGTFVLWALVLFFVPVWIGHTLGHSFFLSAITVMTLVAVVAFSGPLRPAPADLFVVLLLFLVGTQFALGLITVSNATIAVLEWLLPYAWGRLVLARIDPGVVTHCLAWCALAAAVLAIVEFLTGTNVVVLLPVDNSLYTAWGSLQVRGGVLRAEGAWGHSIALGAALAMSAPFVLTAPWRATRRIAALLAVCAGTVLTFSRVGILALVLSISLALVLLPGVGRSVRIAVPAAGLVTGLALLPFVGSVLARAGSEAGDSAAYRGDLFSLFRYVQVFGSAPSFRGATIGGTYLGSFAKSTDNAVLLTGLRLGWLSLVAFLVPLVMVAVSVLVRGRANPASIAVAAQVPTLFVVALITQFGMFLWFLVGLAVAWTAQLRAQEDRERGVPTMRADPVPLTP